MALAQALTEQPRMANHARGLWGYHGTASGGEELNVQATGIGGPSGVAILADLAELGMRRAVRVGSCGTEDPGIGLGELVVVSSGRDRTPGVRDHPLDGPALPNAKLTERLLPGARRVSVGVAASLPGRPAPAEVEVFDLQTVDLLYAAAALSVDLAVVLVAARRSGRSDLDGERLEAALAEAAMAAADLL